MKPELEAIDSLQFIFTTPTFIPGDVTDKLRKERREFHIAKRERERGFWGTEFEIRLKNKLTQRAIARECADWMRRKTVFRSNRGIATMQQFACLSGGPAGSPSDTIYMPLHGFTAVDLGYHRGNAVSNIVTRIDEAPFTATWVNLFDQIWNLFFCAVKSNSGMQMENLAVVALLNDMPEQNLCRGQVGTIVENLAPDVYEVEIQRRRRPHLCEPGPARRKADPPAPRTCSGSGVNQRSHEEQ